MSRLFIYLLLFLILGCAHRRTEKKDSNERQTNVIEEEAVLLSEEEAYAKLLQLMEKSLRQLLFIFLDLLKLRPQPQSILSPQCLDQFKNFL